MVRNAIKNKDIWKNCTEFPIVSSISNTSGSSQVDWGTKNVYFWSKGVKFLEDASMRNPQVCCYTWGIASCIATYLRYPHYSSFMGQPFITIPLRNPPETTDSAWETEGKYWKLWNCIIFLFTPIILLLSFTYISSLNLIKKDYNVEIFSVTLIKCWPIKSKLITIIILLMNICVIFVDLCQFLHFTQDFFWRI
jgi:hypothetical protein